MTTTQRNRLLKRIDDAISELAAIKSAIEFENRDRTVSVAEAIALFGLKKSNVYNRIKDGRLAAIRDGRNGYRLSYNQLKQLYPKQL